MNPGHDPCVASLKKADVWKAEIAVMKAVISRVVAVNRDRV
jgi:hypothetical protein